MIVLVDHSSLQQEVLELQVIIQLAPASLLNAVEQVPHRPGVRGLQVYHQQLLQ